MPAVQTSSRPPTPSRSLKNQKSTQIFFQLQKKLKCYHWKFWEMEWDGISWQPQDIFRDMHQGLKDVEVKVAGFSESVVGLTKVRFPASPGSHSEVEAMISKPKEII